MPEVQRDQPLLGLSFGQLSVDDIAQVVDPKLLQRDFPKDRKWASGTFSRNSLSKQRRSRNGHPSSDSISVTESEYSVADSVTAATSSLSYNENSASPTTNKLPDFSINTDQSNPSATLATGALSVENIASNGTEQPAKLKTPLSPTNTSTIPAVKSWSTLFKDSNATPTHPSKVVAAAAAKLKSPIPEKPKNSLQNYSPTYQSKLIEPRGLINNGNMCFMNAILQPLVHCAPFYNLFRQIASDVKHTFKSQTPLLDAMVLFMNEFIEEGDDRKVFKGGYDVDSFVPEYVYDALHKKKKLLSNKGRQEDAEEFLGFLLDGLHEELLYVINGNSGNTKSVSEPILNEADGWMEVGPKNKTLVTRELESLDSPITQLFGGQMRSIVKCAGKKDSVTTEPFLSLQLDISPDSVSTIEDALINMTKPEVLDGYTSPESKLQVDATKQNLIHKLPPILIFHLKRFVFDNIGGTQKLRKHVGFPHVLKIKPSILTAASKTVTQTLPEYRLFAVVNHHGKHAAGGHYTCDVQRQNEDWIRIDDATITEVSQAQVNLDQSDRQPYMLFFARS